MKTLQHKTVGNLKRRSDLEAATMVATGDGKHNKLSKAAKRHMRKK